MLYIRGPNGAFIVTDHKPSWLKTGQNTAMLTSLFLIALSMISAVAFPHSHNCDCSTQGSNRARRTIDPNVITCENTPNSAACPDVLKQLIWKTRKDGLLRSTTMEAMDIVQQALPTTVAVTELDAAIIGESFYQQLPRIPDLILSDLSIPAQVSDASSSFLLPYLICSFFQIRHLRQMQDAIHNATALLRKFIRSLDHPESHHRSTVSRQYYETLDFALTHIYCPISQLLGVITSDNPDVSIADIPSTPQPDASWTWNCPNHKHCMLMERTMLQQLDKVHDQLTKNFARLQESSSCS